MPPSSSEAPSTRLPAPQRPVGDGTVDSPTPTLAWSAVPDATAYRVQVARTTDFSAPLVDVSAAADEPSVTVPASLPTDGSTCYWRVRAETDAVETDWGPVAPFSSPAEVATDEAPQPMQPVDGAPVDGSAAIFTWSPPQQAARYEIQVAPEPDFQTIVVGLSVEPSTSLTLYDALPTDGRTLHWRLRAQRRDDTCTPWSAPATLTAATDEAVRAHESATAPTEEELATHQRTHAMQTPSEQNSPTTDAGAPVQTASTSSMATLMWAGIVVVSFVATLLLILRALP